MNGPLSRVRIRLVPRAARLLAAAAAGALTLLPAHARASDLQGRYGGPHCADTSFDLGEDGEIVFHAKGDDSPSGWKYRVEGDKVIVRDPALDEDQIVMTRHDGILEYALTSGDRVADQRCGKEMDPDAPTPDDAKSAVAQALGPWSLWLTTYAVRPDDAAVPPGPVGPDTPHWIPPLVESGLLVWQKLGIVKITPMKSAYCSDRAHRQACAGVHEIKVQAGPNAAKYATEFRDDMLAVPFGKRSDLVVTAVRPLPDAPEKRYLVEVANSAELSPEMTQFRKLKFGDDHPHIDQVSRWVLHWVPRYRQWVVMAGDTTEQGKPWRSHFVERFSH